MSLRSLFPPRPILHGLPPARMLFLSLAVFLTLSAPARAQTVAVPPMAPPISWRYVPYPETGEWWLEYDAAPGFTYLIEESQDLAAWQPMAGGFYYGDGSTVRQFVTKGPMPGDPGAPAPPASPPGPAREFRNVPYTLTVAASASSPQIHLKREATTGFAAWDRVLDLPLPRLPGSPPAPRHCYFLDFEDATHVLWNEPTVKTATVAGSGTAAGQQPADTLAYAGEQEEFELAAFLSVKNQLIAWLEYATNPPAPDTTPRPRKFLRVRRTGAADSNDNGVPDWLEMRYGYNVFSNNLADGLDSDSDGMSDKNEVLSGRDPRVADPPDLGLIAGWHDLSLHFCQKSGQTSTTAGEQAHSNVTAYSKSWTPSNPGWDQNNITSSLSTIWTNALGSGAGGSGGVAVTGAEMDRFGYKAFGNLESADSTPLTAFTEGRYSTGAFTSPRASDGYVSGTGFSWIVDGRAREWEVRLHTVTAGALYAAAGDATFPRSPQALTRRFVLLERRQSSGWPITEAVNKGTWTYTVAPVSSTATTLTMAADGVKSSAVQNVSSGAAISRLTLPSLSGTVPDGYQMRSERTLAEIALLADTSRDGRITPRDYYSLQPAVYTVNYGHSENRSGGGHPVEDAIHWKGSDSNTTDADGYQSRIVTAEYEDWRLPVQAPGGEIPKTLSQLRIPGFPFGHPNMKVFLRLPKGSEKKVKAFHLYIARTNNGTTNSPTGLKPGWKEWVPIWGGCTAPPSGGANLPGGEIPSNIRDSYIDITKWVNPQAPGYVDPRPSSAFSDTVSLPCEFALEGILFKGMPYPDTTTGAGTTPALPDGLTKTLGDGGSLASQVFDGILRIGLEFHLDTSSPASNTVSDTNLENSSAALGAAGSWVTLTCAPADPIKTKNGTPVQDTFPNRLAFGNESLNYQDIVGSLVNRAEGYGKFSLGGRYGHVFTVTNTGDDKYDPGSLRHAIESPVPRTIVFALPEGTDGTIELSKELKIKDSYCTIAGQTAFRNGSLGICLKNYGLRITADDVVVRHIRSRPGNSGPSESDSDTDAFAVEGVATRVIIDHCTASFSSDCLIDVATGKKSGGVYYQRPNRRITLQNNLLAWPQDHNNHWEDKDPPNHVQDADEPIQDHGYATLLRGGKGAGITVWRCMFAHCRSRIPRPGGILGPSDDAESLKMDFINNAIYGWGDKGSDSVSAHAGYDGDDGSKKVLPLGQHNIQGNHYLQRLNISGKPKYWFFAGNNQVHAFISGNATGVAVGGGNWTIPVDQYASPPIEYDSKSTRSNLTAGASSRFPTWENDLYAVPTTNAAAGYLQVPAMVGASLERDSLDLRLVGPDLSDGEYYAGQGTIIDNPGQVGGWPKLPAAEPPKDPDGDGLPDEEGAFTEPSVTDRADPRTGILDTDHDGHTNLEAYLNSIAPK